jgi:hypothetical protein
MQKVSLEYGTDVQVKSGLFQMLIQHELIDILATRFLGIFLKICP